MSSIDLPSFVDPGAVAYLMNAIYFNGPWAERFQTKDTKVEAFRGYTRDIKKVKMMHRNDEYSYTANGTYSAVRLPYGNGSFAMTVLLPNEGKSIDDMMRVVNAKEIANLGRKMENCGAGFANDVNERSVGVELYLARLRLVGGHRHDGGGRGCGLSALFAYFDLRFLEHLGNEHIPVRKPAEVGAWLEHCRRAKAGLFKAC